MVNFDSYEFLITLCKGLNAFSGQNLYSYREYGQGIVITAITERELLSLYNLLSSKCSLFVFSLIICDTSFGILCSLINRK